MPNAPNQLHLQIAQRILVHVRTAGYPNGHHLTEAHLQQVLGVTSRGPVRGALAYLAAKGLAERRPNRGYFVSNKQAVTDLVDFAPEDERLYMAIAADRLAGHLDDQVVEAELMRFYDITRHRLQRILTRIAAEGWVRRRVGHGWQFLPMIDSLEAYRESYELRSILEPAGLRSPGFRVDSERLALLQSQQQQIRDGGYREFGQIELFSANSAYHNALAAMSGNRFLMQTVARQNELRRLVEYRQIVNRERVLSQSIEHLEIINHLLIGEVEIAAGLLHRHLVTAAMLKSKPEMFAGTRS